MNILMGIVGIAFTFFLAWIVSSDRKRAFSKWKNILILLAIQLLLAFLLLSTGAGEALIGALATGFNALLGFAAEGVAFVMGDLTTLGDGSAADVFFFNVLLPIIVISALIGILQFTKILPFIIRGLGFLLTKITGMGYLESYNGAASMILGQSEVFISLKNQLPHLPKHRLYTLSAQAMSSVSLSIVGAYMTMLEPQYVVTAIVLNLFGTYVIVHIINPYDVTETEDAADVDDNPDAGKSFFQVLGDYIMDGARVALTVAAMLIGYIALIAILNEAFLLIPGMSITFQDVLGYIFMPIAFLIGIPWSEAQQAGALMATKLITNEFVAMLDYTAIAEEFSRKSQAMVSVFLVSFANFSSIGIIAGSVKGLHNESGDKVARFGLKLVYGASLVSVLTAAVVGFFA
ncbi:NupC/NupG family nucleoside CNT transporter [Salinicoccus sp. ID82-1]|uniref:NupC/NupG family nucleoside CNT transporter n=1 Tax=Salinicoccus cyprini TaxID=2493691 RepID=A0A558ARU4_9STAP|nr:MULTISPECIES: nucleoside transporter C-terminal domain-containing protein [Salinicoccus]MCG1009540.1 NupC/NupG family nucleoside CNT transporter [Salinicoccus sp. ID82-1]TVT26974.1 NupC/NupG family nucleoside CNT transporter [Salinicoccus cyprini]